MAKSIGSLFIDIEARTAKMETQLNGVKAQLGGLNGAVRAQGDAWGATTGQIETKLARFGMLMLGARSMVTLLAREFRNVADNIETLPGIPQETRDQIQAMRHDLEETRRGLRVNLAEAEAFLYKAAKLIGALPAAAIETFMGRGKEAAAALDETVNGATKLTPDQIALDKDQAYPEKLAKAQEELARQTDLAALKTQDEAHQIMALRKEHDELIAKTKDAMGIDLNSLQLTQNRIEALKQESEANSKLAAMRKQLKSEEDKVHASLEKGATATLSAREAVDAYRNTVWRLRNELTQINAVLKDDPNDPVMIQMKIDKTKQLAEAQTGYNAAIKKYGDMAQQAGQAVAQGFQDAVFQGQGLHKMLQTLLGDLLKVIFQKEITAPLADFLTGGFKSLFSIGGHAMGGPLSGPSMVGERGPELFVPSGYGTIIPNDQLRSGGGGTTFYVDARGADESRIAQMERALIGLHASVERRSVAATLDVMRRGGAVSGALRGI